MRLLRRFLLLAAVAVGSAVLAGPAFATAPDASLTHQLGSTHFLVHFTTDINTNAFAITATEAGDIAALAERAYSAELADGYSAPPSDFGIGPGGGDNRIDIYVQAIAAQGEAGEADPNAVGPSSGYILLDSDFGTSYHVIAHEFFHLLQFGIYASNDLTDGWLYEAAAEWMGYRTDAYSDSGGSQPITVGYNEFTLDCRDPIADQILCSRDSYYNDGYSRWVFFQFLADKYGNAFVKDIFAQLAINGPGTSLASLTAALVAKGTTLADTYNAWATAELNGAYSVKALQGLKPTVYVSVPTGINDKDATVTKVPVNHLAMRFVQFVRGDNDASHLCYEATLNVSVALPAGTQSKPAFYWDVKGGSPVQLTVNGSTASAAIPWDTCTYASNSGYLSLPNASASVDAADFVVTTTLSVDLSQQATPIAPPDPAFTTTPVIPVTSVDVAPTLFMFGPELLKLTPTDTQLRLIVQSNGQGTVQAKLGSVVLGTLSVRGGNNDLRFKLPAGVLNALRRAAAAGNILTLTPVSTNGLVTGQAVTRTVSVLAPKHKVAKRKVAKLKVKVKLHRK
jgi:hypothetical protein